MCISITCMEVVTVLYQDTKVNTRAVNSLDLVGLCFAGLHCCWYFADSHDWWYLDGLLYCSYFQPSETKPQSN